VDLARHDLARRPLDDGRPRLPVDHLDRAVGDAGGVAGPDGDEGGGWRARELGDEGAFDASRYVERRERGALTFLERVRRGQSERTGTVR
jgi:hypothetical protein